MEEVKDKVKKYAATSSAANFQEESPRSPESLLEFPQFLKSLSVSPNFFNNGWIPLLGWTCGSLILLYYFPQIIVITYVWAKDCIQTGKVTAYPLKPDDIVHLVYILFGFGVHSLFKGK